jgi:hypothetical protein
VIAVIARAGNQSSRSHSRQWKPEETTNKKCVTYHVEDYKCLSGSIPAEIGKDSIRCPQTASFQKSKIQSTKYKVQSTKNEEHSEACQKDEWNVYVYKNISPQTKKTK